MLTFLAGVVAPGLPAHAATGEIIGADSGEVIPGQYIVVLNDKLKQSTKDSAQALTDQYRGRLGQVWGRTLNGFAVAMDEAQAKRLAADPRVAYVEQESVFRIADTQENPPSPGIDRVDQRTVTLDTAYTYDAYPSTPVNVYVLDTGIRITHNDFGGRASHGWDFVDGDAIADDCNGHGTHMAGTIGGITYGVAKNARMKAVRAFTCGGTATEANLLSAIDWITNNAVKPAVANLSLGKECTTGAGQPAPCPAGSVMAVRTAIANSIATGITYVVAAGNQNIDACGSPLNLVTTAISVGGSNTTDGKLNISNWGSCVDIWAPGQSIVSAYMNSDTDFGVGDGSSMAAAHVSGAVALMLTRPGYSAKTPAQLSTQLLAEATTGALSGMGAGSPDKLLYTSPPPVAGGSPVALGRNADGRLTLFGVNYPANLFVRSQVIPNSPAWTTWTTSIDPNWYSVCADTEGLNRVKLMGLRRNYEPWHRTQAVVNTNTWSTWQKFDGLLNSCAIATESGRLYLYGTNAKGDLWTRSEILAGSGAFTPWTQIPVIPVLRSVAAERNGLGQIQVFGLGRGGEIWHCYNGAAACATTGWSQMDGLLKTIAVARGAGGALTIFGVNAMGQLYRRDSVPNVPSVWLPWEQLDVPANVGTLRSVAAETNEDGRIELVAVNLAGAIWRRSQTSAGSNTYGAWVSLDGLLRP